MAPHSAFAVRRIGVRSALTFGLLVVLAAAPLLRAASAGVYNIRDFGATGDGKTLDSPAINRAIDAAHAAGGGTVYFPAGTYLSVTLRLKSHIALHLDQGATLLAASPKDGHRYDPAEPNEHDMYQDFGHTHWRNSLIWGEGLENISIYGPGLIHGEGLVRSGGQSRSKEAHEALRGKTPEGRTRGPHGYPDARDAVEPGYGNKAIALKLCRNVIIRDLTIREGGHFAILATGVDNLTIDNVKMDTNRDGMDIDACRHVRIANCTINSPWDDGICLKSSYALGFARATENVTITNCQVSGYDEGSYLDGTYTRNVKDAYAHDTTTGRIKFGTESNGGFKNITISNCLFDYSRGLAIETVDGGVIEDVTITNITMRDITDTPIFIRLGNRARGPGTLPVSVLRRVKISHVIAHNVASDHGIIIAGLPDHRIEDVTLSDILITYRGGGTREQAARVVPEFEQDYPEPYRFGTLPSYGIFARHIRGLTLDRVEVRTMAEDQRPAFWLHDVQGADLAHVRATRTEGAPFAVLKDVTDFTLRHSPGVADTQRDAVTDETL